MIHFIIKENFILKKIIERRKECFVSRNGFLIKEFKSYNQDEIKYFAKKYPDGFFRYVFYEKGGETKFTKNSFSEIVCSRYGEKLMPIKVIKKFFGIDEPNAIFVGTDLNIVRMFYKKRNVYFTITNYLIEPKTGDFLETLIAADNYTEIKNNLPESLKCFERALSAAYKRLHDYQCVKVYYSL